MNIYPAIDLKDGQCVRLFQGSYDQVTKYTKDPIAQAKAFADQGANVLHVVDLDGAKVGRSVNLNLIEKITQTSGLLIQCGGGIRSKQQITDMFDLGIFRVVLGSVAVTLSGEVKKWLQEYGSQRIVLALDIRIATNNDPIMAVHGWQTSSEENLWQLLAEYETASLLNVLCTDIERDGTLQGPNLALYNECVKRFPAIHFQASGGISSLTDLRQLARIPMAGAIIGKALYENKFTLESAINEVSLC